MRERCIRISCVPMFSQKAVIVFLPLLFFSACSREQSTDLTGAEKARLLTQFAVTEAPQSPALLTDDQALRNALVTYGPVATMQAMRQTAYAQGADCHNRAHQLGRMGFEEFGTEVFKLSIPECHSGFYHGAIEAFFKKNGTATLKQDLSTICIDGLNGFFAHQCLHGIGHGLMAWANYDLPGALEFCNLIPQPTGQSSCRTGAFMENIVGSLDDSAEAKGRGHVTKYLTDDPQYPCSIVKDQYKGDCYFLQTDRMLALSRTGYKGVAEECAKAPTLYHISCFASMGRTIGGQYRGHPKEAIEQCGFVTDPANRIHCTLGAAQDTFWDKNGETLAHEFCALVPENGGKKECYQTIIGRSHEILSTEDQEAFCSRLPVEHQEECTKGII